MDRRPDAGCLWAGRDLVRTGQPPQELVQGAAAGPEQEPGPDRLLRVDADGRCTRVRTEDRVRSVQAEPDALLIRVDVPPWTLQHLGAQTYEVSWATRWLRLPWDADVPEVVTLASDGSLGTADPGNRAPVARYDDGGRLDNHWYDPTADPGDLDDVPLVALGLRWHLGWPRAAPGEPRGQWRRVEASAHDSHGMVRHWDLGEGTILAAAPVGARLAVAVARSPRTDPQDPEPVDVLALNPAQPRVIVLLPPASIDISAQCWPLVPRPLDADSYAAQVLAANDDIEHFWHGPDGIAPLAGGLSQARTALVGDWPETHLEWTFAFEGYPGVRLRRRVALFDELGRATEPEYAAIHLMEDLDTMALPPAGAARDSILDI